MDAQNGCGSVKRILPHEGLSGAFSGVCSRNNLLLLASAKWQPNK